MNSHAEGELVTRKIGTAVGLSLLMSGLGHLYCGRLVIALVWAVIATISSAALLMNMAAGWSAASVALVIALGVWIVAAVHAARDVRRVQSAYRLREYNRPIVYVLLGLIGCAGSVGYAAWVREKYAEPFVIQG